MIDNASSEVLSSRPVVARDIDVGIQLIRGEQWAVVQNRVSGSFIRIREPVWRFVTLLQGQITVKDWLMQHEQQIGSDELLSTLVTLNRNGIVAFSDKQAGEVPDQLSRGSSGAASPLRFWANPLMIRIALFDPNRLSGRLNELTKAATLKSIALGSLIIALWAIVLGVANGGELAIHWQYTLQSPRHWWSYLLLYPMLKLVHEIAHAVVLRRMGGEVHEAGISFLVFMPLPYVNATDSWKIANRHHRMMVTGAGMWVEGLLAAVGLIGFCLLQPGLFRDMLFGIFVLGSASTILFNANPLLKFDGYYLLEDALELPGLARRSQLLFRYFYKKYILRIETLYLPVTARGEQKWLLIYGVSSTFYRCFISIVIAVFLVNTLHEVGVLLAIVVLMSCFVRPVLVWINYLLTATELEMCRPRSILNNCILAGLFFLLVFTIPLPSSTRAEGIVWVPEQAELFAAEDGNIVQWMANDGDWIDVGQSVLRLESPQLMFEQEAINAEVKVKQLEHDTLKLSQPNQARRALAELSSLNSRLAHLDERVQSLEIKASVAGRLAKNGEALGAGRQLTQGQLLGYIVDPQSLIVRAVVDQQQVGRVRTGIREISVRVAHSVGNRVAAKLTQVIPTGDNALPSLALADVGYGGIAMDADQAQGTRTSEQIFHLELELLEDTQSSGIGGLAYVNLQHRPETLASRWWRGSRQLMLKHLPV